MIGRSATTGNENCLIWNGIHHKTVKDATGSLHGYPGKDSSKKYFTFAISKDKLARFITLK